MPDERRGRGWRCPSRKAEPRSFEARTPRGELKVKAVPQPRSESTDISSLLSRMQLRRGGAPRLICSIVRPTPAQVRRDDRDAMLHQLKNPPAIPREWTWIGAPMTAGDRRCLKTSRREPGEKSPQRGYREALVYCEGKWCPGKGSSYVNTLSAGQVLRLVS